MKWPWAPRRSPPTPFRGRCMEKVAEMLVAAWGRPGRGEAAVGCSQEPRDGGPACAALTGDSELPRPG